MSLNYVDLFDRAVSFSRRRLALVDAEHSFTFDELQRRTNRIAHAMLARGAQPSSPFGVLSPNSTLAMTSLIAGLRAGGAWMNLNFRNALSVNTELMARGRLETLFYHPSVDLEQVRREVPTLKTWVPLDGGFGGFGKDAPETPIVVRLGAKDTAILGTTGGTTGKAKVVRLPPDFLALNNLAFMNAFAMDQPPVNLALAPITHAGGIVAEAVLALGGTVHLMATPSLDELLALIPRLEVSLLFLPPTLIYMLLNHPKAKDTDFSSLRYLMSAAAPINAEKIRAAQQLIGPVVCQCYGQTETGFPVTFMPPHVLNEAAADPKLAHRLHSCGRITPTMAAVEIMGEDGQLLPPGETGEIVARGPTTMLEYVDDPEATSAIQAGGWQHTGDVGYKDEDGFLYISDRKRDLIITGGFNVFPLQVEQVLASHPAVQDSAVIGVPDDKWGEAVKAVVELAPGRSATEEELIALCKDKLGSVAAPKSVDFVKTLPRSVVGKVLKRELRLGYWQGKSEKI